jgi:phosphatidylglycerol:prolipoprotein diacylglycerol transferase
MFPVIADVGIPIYSYGVMLGTSLFVAWYVVMYLGERREGIPKDQLANAFIVTAIVAIVFARVLYIATNPNEFDSLVKFIDLRSGGLVAYGGFLGGLLGSWLYWRNKPTSLAAWADVAAPTLGLGLGFTRIGCYLFGCDFGARLSENAPSWLVTMGTFPGAGGGLGGEGSPAFMHHVQHYDLAPDATTSLPVHPTQIYESLLGFALAGVAMLVWHKRTFRGQVILVITAIYAVWRFFIEYVRDDPERGEYFGFSTSQWISLALLPVAIAAYVALRKNKITPAAPIVATAGDAPKAEVPDATKSTGAVKKKKKKKRA